MCEDSNAIFVQATDNEVWQGVANHMMKIASYGIRNQGSLLKSYIILPVMLRVKVDLTYSLRYENLIVRHKIEPKIIQKVY